MERISLERFAWIFLDDARQCFGARHIDDERESEHDDRSDAGFDVYRAEEEPFERFENDVEGGDEEKRGFNERRKIFEFAVAVGMALIGRLIGDADGEEGDHRGDQIESGMQRFGQNAQAAGAQDKKRLE